MPLDTLSLVRQHRRRATIAPFVIVALMVMLAAFALAANKAWLWGVREEVRSAADTAALAAARTFWDDDLLKSDTDLLPDLFRRATQSAHDYAFTNLVRGNGLTMLDNPANDPRGDLVFGIKTTPFADIFTAVPGRNTPAAEQLRTNTFVVQGRQTRTRGNAPGLIFGLFAGGNTNADVQGISAVTLDRGIRGVRPRFGKVPLAPFALRSDPSAADPRSWENQVESRTGPDGYQYSRTQKRLIVNPLGDQIHEFQASYATEPMHLATSNVALLHIPSDDLFDIGYCLQFGVDTDDLENFDGRFVIPDSGVKDTPGQQVGPEATMPNLRFLVQSLQELEASGEVRIWPLYTSFNDPQGLVRVTGFVAARVASVAPAQDDQPVTFTLQATTLSAPYAVTDADLRGKDATQNSNRYIARLRRIE